jgi:hypothetical protein
MSVVPTTSLSCQGMAKSTRPSGVLGIINAESPGMKLRSSTRWMPWLGTMWSVVSLLSMASTALVKTPVQLTTTFAWIV